MPDGSSDMSSSGDKPAQNGGICDDIRAKTEPHEYPVPPIEQEQENPHSRPPEEVQRQAAPSAAVTTNACLTTETRHVPTLGLANLNFCAEKLLGLFTSHYREIAFSYEQELASTRAEMQACKTQAEAAQQDLKTLAINLLQSLTHGITPQNQTSSLTERNRCVHQPNHSPCLCQECFASSNHEAHSAQEILSFCHKQLALRERKWLEKAHSLWKEGMQHADAAAKLHQELGQATAALQEAEERERQARQAATDAIRRANDLESQSSSRCLKEVDVQVSLPEQTNKAQHKESAVQTDECHIVYKTFSGVIDLTLDTDDEDEPKIIGIGTIAGVKQEENTEEVNQERHGLSLGIDSVKARDSAIKQPRVAQSSSIGVDARKRSEETITANIPSSGKRMASAEVEGSKNNQVTKRPRMLDEIAAIPQTSPPETILAMIEAQIMDIVRDPGT